MRQAALDLIQDKDVKAVFAASMLSAGFSLAALNSALTTIVLIGSVIVTWRKVFGKKPPEGDEGTQE